MIRLHIIAEGQTEEEFVYSMLTEYLGYFNIVIDVHCVTPNRKIKKRGGVVSYDHVKKDISIWLKQDQGANVRLTTMLDLYALPSEFPKFDEAKTIENPYDKVKFLEEAFFEDIQDKRFIPYIQLHEFEALILSEPSKFVERFPDYKQEVQQLTELCSQFESPELINDGRTTAPSKRINQLIPIYENSKTSAAPFIAEKIGLAKIREHCPHFDEWMTFLEKLTEA